MRPAPKTATETAQSQKIKQADELKTNKKIKKKREQFSKHKAGNYIKANCKVKKITKNRQNFFQNITKQKKKKTCMIMQSMQQTAKASKEEINAT